MPTSCASARSVPPTPALRAVRHPLIRDAHPRHRVALGTLLLSRLAPRVLRPLQCRLSPSGRSSLEGGMEELPLFREPCRSSRRTRSSSATLDSRNRSTRAISSSRDSSSNPDTAQDHHISQPTHHTRHAEDQTTDLNAYPRRSGHLSILRLGQSLIRPGVVHGGVGGCRCERTVSDASCRSSCPHLP